MIIADSPIRPEDLLPETVREAPEWDWATGRSRKMSGEA